MGLRICIKFFCGQAFNLVKVNISIMEDADLKVVKGAV